MKSTKIIYSAIVAALAFTLSGCGEESVEQAYENRVEDGRYEEALCLKTSELVKAGQPDVGDPVKLCGCLVNINEEVVADIVEQLIEDDEDTSLINYFKDRKAVYKKMQAEFAEIEQRQGSDAEIEGWYASYIQRTGAKYGVDNEIAAILFLPILFDESIEEKVNKKCGAYMPK